MTSTAFGPQLWNRDELYQDVWNQPLTSLIAKYGGSVVAIGKTCRKLQIPLPGRGYWAKKAHGHPVAQQPLPKLHEVPLVVRHQRPAASATNPSPPPKPEFSIERIAIASGQIMDSKRLSWRSSSRSLNSLCLLRGAFTLSKLALFVIVTPAQFRDRFRSLSNVNRSGSQNASKNAAAAAEKTE